MAKLGIIKRLVDNDFPSKKYNDLLPNLFGAINQFIDQVTYALNKNITFTDNFAAVDSEIQVTGNGAGSFIKWPYTTPCKGAMVLSVTNNTNSSAVLSSAPFIEFEASAGQITIKNITGLQTNNKYTLRVVFFT
jgi:hypothetical protein